MEREITRREVLKRLGAVGIAAAGFGGGRTIRDCRADNIRVFDSETREEDFCGRTIGYDVFYTDAIPKVKFISNLGETPSWTDGQNVYHNPRVYEKMAEEGLFKRTQMLKETYTNRQATLSELAENSDEWKFYTALKDVLRWKAWSRFYEAYKDSSKRAEEFSKKFSRIVEFHELPTIAIQRGRAPDRLNRYKIYDSDEIKRYLEKYVNLKVIGAINMGQKSDEIVSVPDDVLATAAGWYLRSNSRVIGKDEDYEYPYCAAGKKIFGEVAKQIGKDEKTALIEFAELDEKEKSEFFLSLDNKLFGVDF